MRDAVHFDSTRNESFEKKKNRDGEGDGRQTIYLKSNSFEKFRRASFRTAVGRAASAAPQWKATELQADLCYTRLVPRWKEPSPLCSENLFILIMTLNSNQSTSTFCKKKIHTHVQNESCIKNVYFWCLFSAICLLTRPDKAYSASD